MSFSFSSILLPFPISFTSFSPIPIPVSIRIKHSFKTNFSDYRGLLPITILITPLSEISYFFISHMLLGLLLLSIGAHSFVHKEVGLAADVGTLEYVHAVWRHGDRTPAELLYPEDAVKWPEGIGELTSQGAGETGTRALFDFSCSAQQFRLGQWLRRRYGEWLGEQFQRDTVY